MARHGPGLDPGLSSGRNCAAVSAQRCNEAGDYNPPPALLIGAQPLSTLRAPLMFASLTIMDAGDIYISPGYNWA